MSWRPRIGNLTLRLAADRLQRSIGVNRGSEFVILSMELLILLDAKSLCVYGATIFFSSKRTMCF